MLKGHSTIRGNCPKELEPDLWLGLKKLCKRLHYIISIHYLIDNALTFLVLN